MKYGAIIRAPLEKCLRDYNEDRTYDHLEFLVNNGCNLKLSHKNNCLESVIGRDLVFYLHFPYDGQLSEKLTQYEDSTFFVNSPKGVRKTSEKTFEINHLSDYLPETLILNQSSDDEVLDFIRDHDKIILKPIDGTGGKGVQLLDKKRCQDEILEYLKKIDSSVSPGYLAQEFIENNGDLRVICYAGEILGHFGRYNPNKLTNNVSGGGSINKEAFFSKQDIQMCKDISEKMMDFGIFYTGIDVLESKILEVNVACPGGIGLCKPYKVKSELEMMKRFEEITNNLAKQYGK